MKQFKKHLFRLKTPKRVFILSVEETKHEIVLNLTATIYDRNLGDEQQFGEWFADLTKAYEDDRRPLVMRNQHSGQLATINKLGDIAFAVVETPVQFH